MRLVVLKNKHGNFEYLVTNALATDLTTLELDVAAIEHGYARPDERAFPLEVSVIDGGG